MKKAIPKIIFFVSILSMFVLLTACGGDDGSGSPVVDAQASGANSEVKAVEKSVVSVDNIAEAISLNKDVVCVTESTDPQIGTIKSTTYISDERARIDTVTSEGTSHAIFDDKKFYIWQDGESEGILMDLSKVAEMQQTKEEPSLENALQNYDADPSLKTPGYSMKCEQKSISSSQFTPPSSIEFVDFFSQLGNFVGTAGQQ